MFRAPLQGFVVERRHIRSCSLYELHGCFCKLCVRFLGVLRISALPFGVYSRALVFGNSDIARRRSVSSGKPQGHGSSRDFRRGQSIVSNNPMSILHIAILSIMLTVAHAALRCIKIVPKWHQYSMVLINYRPSPLMNCPLF